MNSAITSPQYKKTVDDRGEVNNDDPVEPDAEPPGGGEEGKPGGGVDVLELVELNLEWTSVSKNKLSGPYKTWSICCAEKARMVASP